MAENNLLMTIVLVVAATLLFSGGLTGNASRYQENFGFTTTQPLLDSGGEVVCSPVKEGKYLSNGKPAIVQINSDCSETVTDLCADSSRPFITNQRVVECRGLAISSANDAFGAQ